MSVPPGNPSGVAGTPRSFGSGAGPAAPGAPSGGTEAGTLRSGHAPAHAGSGATQERQDAGSPRSYYGRAILAEPVWEPVIAAYFFTGGMAGAAATLGAVADRMGDPVLGRRARLVALVGIALSPPLLIYDLGRPKRFIYMLRVFKPTSPMSVGTWVLSVMGGAMSAAVAGDLLGRPRLARAAGAMAGALGPVLSTYTAVLIADTAVPVWHEGHRELPWVFAGSSAASAGALLAASEPARRMAIGGAVLELAAVMAYERRLGPLAEPLHQGRAGQLGRGAKALSAAGAAALVFGGRRSALRATGAACLMAASALERLSIFRSGKSSALDPRYVTVPQRERLQAGRPARP